MLHSSEDNLNIEQSVFEAPDPADGPRILFFGGIHGNEPCGPRAIKNAIALFENGDIRLKRGSVHFVPIANPRAYRDKKRYIDEDLNRIFRKTEHPRSYEAHLANTLCDIAD